MKCYNVRGVKLNLLLIGDQIVLQQQTHLHRLRRARARGVTQNDRFWRTGNEKESAWGVCVVWGGGGGEGQLIKCMVSVQKGLHSWI